MCLVEVEKSPKPVASCAFHIMRGMKIKTDIKLIKKARQAHDQSVRYGSDRGRFSEVVGKRAVEDKELGLLIKATMTRCIHSDALFLIGTNPHHEAAVMNPRIRKSFANGLNVGLVGAPVDLSYGFAYIGADTSSLEAIVSSKHSFAAQLAEAKNPVIIVSSGAKDLPGNKYVFSAVSNIIDRHKDRFSQKNWNDYNVLKRAASRAAAYDIGFVPQAKQDGRFKFVYLLEADEISPNDIPNNAFVVHQGHHGDVGALYTDVIFTRSHLHRKSATYVNTEGRSQMTRAAVPPPGAAREDWKIIRALSEVAGATLPYDDEYVVHDRLRYIAPSFASHNVIEPSSIGVASLDLSTLNRSSASRQKQY
ncbi:hypothetical protein BGZ82_007179 [Podila clonocystis]|nr:hypothetical protein BGZ82_007179 [Podila clonocystis]